MAKYWYAYNGVDDPFSSSSYERFIPPNRPTCTNGIDICAIYASGSSTDSTPDSPLSINVRQYIALALTSGNIPIPNGPGLKPYVYLAHDE